MIMTPQEKASAYDKAIERARRMIEDYKNRGLKNYIAYAKENIDYIFPELKESEGESMKESLITFFRKYPYSIEDAGINPLDAIAWLEKQGEHKVEPKFKVGEWIIFDENHNGVYQVEKIQGLRYYLRHYLGGTLSVHFDNELIRLWNLQDAKDGDVLYENDTKTILIFKSQNCGWIKVYCDYWISKDKYTGTDHADYGRLSEMKLTPATKEQRDKLEKAMADAGYTFDFEKKELKKIEQKPTLEDAAKTFLEALSETPYNNTPIVEAQIITKQLLIFLSDPKSYNPDAINEQNRTEWSEEDENLFNRCVINIQMVDSDDTLKIWLKSLKDRVQPHPQSDERNRLLGKLEEWLDEYVSDLTDVDTATLMSSFTNYLDGKLPKSLRPQNRWKPSDEQMDALAWALSLAKNCGEESAFELNQLQEQLKKLRKE